MKFEVLKKSHLKRNIIIGIVIVAIISACILTFTKAKYRTTQSIPLVNGTINYSLADLNVVALYIDGEETTKLDNTKQYTLDTEQSTCTYKDGTEIPDLSISYDSETGGLSISPYTTKGTKCTLYFNELKGRTMLDIITNDYSQSTRSNFGSAYTTSHTKQVFTTTDWEGTSYYFAGAPTDNWVSFGGFYWRIIRVNGDGSVRLLYNGTTTGATGSGTLTKTSQAFNSSYNRSEYVGLKYTSGEQHGQNSNSTILTELNSWYTSSNLDDHASHIDTNIGCSNDIIKVPVGLITADEAMFGGVPRSGYATGNYLINGQYYWTMSPYNFYGGSNSWARVFCVRSVGDLGNYDVNGTRGVRPVINLLADTRFTGDGTASNPYVIAT